MSWQTTLDIAGVTSNNLVAGAEAAGVDAGRINIYGVGGESGALNNGSAITGGEIHVSNGGVANSTTISGGKIYISAGGRANSITFNTGVSVYLYKNGEMNDVTINGGGVILLKGTANTTYLVNGSADVTGSAISTTLTRGWIRVRVGGKASNTIVNGGNMYVAYNGNAGAASSTTIFDGTVHVSNNGIASDATVNGGNMSVYTGGVASNVIVNPNGTLTVNNGGSAEVVFNPWQGTVTSNEGANITYLTRDKGVYYGGAAAGLIEKGDSLDGLIVNAGNSAIVYGGGEMTSTTVAGGEVTISGGELTSTVINAGNMYVSAGTATSTTLSNGNVHVSEGGVASDTTVYGGFMRVSSAGVVSNATIVSGGSLVLDVGAVTRGALTVDLTGFTKTTDNNGLINDLNRVADDTAVLVKISEWNVNSTFRVVSGQDKTKEVTVTDGAATATLTSGLYITNPFTSVRYLWNGARLQGQTYTFGKYTGTAGSLASNGQAANINDGDLATRWLDVTAFTSGNVYLAGETTNGKAAWLEIDGYEGGAGTTLYGAQGDAFSEGTVNINAKSGSLRNLAAGANAGGTVKAVNLTFAGAELDGTGYAGGFGNVTDKVNTTITTGTFAKDFYAGALANKLTTATSVGNVSMTVAGGTFDGNIYGASAVKTDSTKGTGTRHTAGDVTLTVTGGSTTKGAQACIFAGGYATGTATGTVYKVDSVTATISGGSWGEAAGGRGVFGGIFASGVEAQVLGDVNITISGDATMGNVYGGGWAQKTGAKSIVGDVNINIEGGTIANVFGGGSHSTSGGTTETGDVTITVSGGNITGDIYARGQLDGDTTGNAAVIFTGAADFSCGVYGYSYVGGVVGGAALSFSAYTGEFSGKIGGFDGITFDGATAMELTTATADVSNGAWEFDLTDRASTLAGTSLLTWDEGSFENDSIKVSFADDTQAQGGWNIVTDVGTFSGTTFCVEIGGTEIASGLAYNQQIASGDYAGWGFELESGVLKFKQLA